MAFFAQILMFLKTVSVRQTLNIGKFAEVLIILVVTALPFAEVPHIIDELDRSDPFHHLEAELAFDPQPERDAMQRASGFEFIS